MCIVGLCGQSRLPGVCLSSCMFVYMYIMLNTFESVFAGTASLESNACCQSLVCYYYLCIVVSHIWCLVPACPAACLSTNTFEVVGTASYRMIVNCNAIRISLQLLFCWVSKGNSGFLVSFFGTKPHTSESEGQNLYVIKSFHP